MVVMYLLGITVLVYFADLLTGGLLSANFALVPALVFQRPWTLITSIFLHDITFPIHIFFNMFGLLVFGPILQAKVGPRNFIILYLVTGLLGNLGFILTTGIESKTAVIGASGAIFGILGSLAVLQPNLMVLVGFIPMPIYIAAVVWFLMEFSYGVTGAQAGIANFAHLFGLVGGLLLGRHFKEKIGKRGAWFLDEEKQQ